MIILPRTYATVPLSQIKSTAGQCGMTRSDFIRARALNYRPRQRLSVTEVDGLRQLAACRTDMVNFANALHGLNDDEKVRLFRHQPTMLEWYEKVARMTDHVTDFLSPRRRRTAIRQGQRTKRQRRMPYDSQGKIHQSRHQGDAVRVG